MNKTRIANGEHVYFLIRFSQSGIRIGTSVFFLPDQVKMRNLCRGPWIHYLHKNKSFGLILSTEKIIKQLIRKKIKKLAQ